MLYVSQSAALPHTRPNHGAAALRTIYSCHGTRRALGDSAHYYNKREKDITLQISIFI